ncbi:MAG: hypothetical protein MR659_00825 [Mollicutes bacterium]|nr:hypothetical protein [Mollicutes bacterium]MDD7715136.1 hypothetical protein [Mollicutes bacterium]
METILTIASILGVINTIISMIACPIIAAHKNRSVSGWIFGGFLLGLIGLIIIACLPNND